MKTYLKNIAVALFTMIALALAATPAAAGNAIGLVNALEMNKGSTTEFYRITIIGTSSGCGSALTNNTTYLFLNHESVEALAGPLIGALQGAKLLSASVQVWWGSDCHITDVVQL